MKRVKQWEKPEIGVVARSSSMEAAGAPGRGGFIGPVPAPSPVSTDAIRRDSTRSFIGLGPLPPSTEVIRRDSTRSFIGLGPLPPATEVIRRDSTRSFIGLGPLPPVLD